MNSLTESDWKKKCQKTTNFKTKSCQARPHQAKPNQFEHNYKPNNANIRKRNEPNRTEPNGTSNDRTTHVRAKRILHVRVLTKSSPLPLNLAKVPLYFILKTAGHNPNNERYIARPQRCYKGIALRPETTGGPTLHTCTTQRKPPRCLYMLKDDPPRDLTARPTV